MWQDAIFTTGTVLFGLALIPTIYASAKPDLWTSALTAAVLAMFTVAHFTLTLWFASAASAILAVEWSVLGYQRWRQLGWPAEEEE